MPQVVCRRQGVTKSLPAGHAVRDNARVPGIGRAFLVAAVVAGLVPTAGAVQPPRGLAGTARLLWRASADGQGTMRIALLDPVGLAEPVEYPCARPTSAFVLRFGRQGTPGTSLVLPCEPWRIGPTRASYRVRRTDAPGGVTQVRWRPGRLDVVVRDAAAPGAAGWLEVHLVTGGRRACGRIGELPADAARVAVLRPLDPCADPCGDGLVETAAGEVCDPGVPGASPCCTGRCERSLACDVTGDGRRRLLCVGDSNTENWVWFSASWCEIARQLLPGWEIVNLGLFGAWTPQVLGLLPDWLDAHTPDLVVTALGTNDLGFGTPAEVSGWLRRLDGLVTARCTEGRGCVGSMIATVPPVYTTDHPHPERIEPLNALLAGWVPPRRLLDFHSDMPPEDFFDGLHLGYSGQAKRAQRVRDLLALE